jgi:hypothetical protein
LDNPKKHLCKSLTWEKKEKKKAMSICGITNLDSPSTGLVTRAPRRGAPKVGTRWCHRKCYTWAASSTVPLCACILISSQCC